MPIYRKLLETIWDLHKKKRSGILRIERGSEKKQLVLRNGLLVFAESNVAQEHLARILVNLNLLPQTKMKEISSMMKGGKTSEEAVLQMPGLSMQELEKGKREQATLILASMWAWNHCNIRFYAGDDLVRYHVNLGLSLPEILVVSARRAIAGRMVPLQRSILQGAFGISEDCPWNPPELPLSAAESHAYTLFCEPLSGTDALTLISEKDAHPEQILFLLYLLGLISYRDHVKPSAEPASTAEQNSVLQSLEDTLLQFESASLYEILSIPIEARQEEVQSAYHALARQFHPDRFQSRDFSEETRAKAEQIFTCINKAYITLKDPASRAEYNEKRLTTESKVEAELRARAAKKTEDEKGAEALFRDGRAMFNEGEVETAIERFKGCVWLNPEKAVYHHYLGLAESEVPKLRKSAEQHFLKAIELDKLAHASRLALAKLYIKAHLRRKAELMLQELIQWNPESSEVQKLTAELQNLETRVPG